MIKDSLRISELIIKYFKKNYSLNTSLKSPFSHFVMDVFGLKPIQVTIIVTIIGVGLQVGLGYLKSGNAFDGRQLLTSAIIAIVISFTIVGAAVQSIPEGADDMTVFLILIGVVAAIAGIDQLVKNTGGAIVTKLRE